jgi:hypothetical protein
LFSSLASVCAGPLLFLVFEGDDFTALVVAAGGADAVRQARLLATRAILNLHRIEVVVTPAFALTGPGGPSLGDSHGCSAFY